LAEMTMTDRDPHRIRTDCEADRAAQTSAFVTGLFMMSHGIPLRLRSARRQLNVGVPDT
jgi:hypothetical protein